MLAQGGLPQRFAEDMGRLLGPDFPKTLALAVSGGGDSVAMLHLAAPWARIMGVGLHVVTVDHGLRAQSAQEAELVAREAAQLGLPHATLRWHWDGTGNLQAAARAARLGLIDAWRGSIDHVLFAHTRDDVAETFLMRLARGSGVDGLAAMQAIKTFQSPRKMCPLPSSDVSGAPAPNVAGVSSPSFQVVRPLLETSRAELRHYLRVLHVDHVEDPSNDDPRFDRVKARKALPLLEELGITPARLADTAAQLRRGSDALAARAGDALESCLRRAPGDLVFDVTFHRDAFATYERETQLRLLAAALQFVSFAPMRPRLPALEEALDRALSGGATTLHGGYVYPQGPFLFIVAELDTMRDCGAENGLWRGHFDAGDAEVRVLGEKGAAQLRGETGLPARVLWPSPAIWAGDRVVAAPRLGQNPHWNPPPEPERLWRLVGSR